MKVRWIPKCYPLFSFWYLCVPWESTYPTLKLCLLLFLCCLYPLLVLFAFDSFQVHFFFSSLSVQFLRVLCWKDMTWLLTFKSHKWNELEISWYQVQKTFLNAAVWAVSYINLKRYGNIVKLWGIFY